MRPPHALSNYRGHENRLARLIGRLKHDVELLGVILSKPQDIVSLKQLQNSLQHHVGVLEQMLDPEWRGEHPQTSSTPSPGAGND